MTLTDQIHKIQKRLEEKPDPLLAEVLKSLKKLEKLNTVEGLIEFHKREFCNVDDAAKYLGCEGRTARKNVLNYFKPPGRSHRIDIPAITMNEGKQRQYYVVVKRGLKPLKQKYHS